MVDARRTALRRPTSGPAPGTGEAEPIRRSAGPRAVAWRAPIGRRVRARVTASSAPPGGQPHEPGNRLLSPSLAVAGLSRVDPLPGCDQILVRRHPRPAERTEGEADGH